MPFNSHTASLAGKKSKRGKSKLTPDIQDRLDLLAAENLDYLLSHLDELNNSEGITNSITTFLYNSKIWYSPC